MSCKHSTPRVKIVADVHSRVHYCREGALVQLTGGLADCPETDAPDDFLALCAAAFSHPFYALLCRSSVSSPYALLYM